MQNAFAPVLLCVAATLLIACTSLTSFEREAQPTQDAGPGRATEFADGSDDASTRDARPNDLRPPTPRDRFAGRVVSFSPGACAGFGAERLPSVVLGPPEGGGTLLGSLDVLSLGTGGSIELAFEDNPIADGPGPDFLVFENPFLRGGDPLDVFAEPGEVSVSEDGVTWKVFPCEATVKPYRGCAGVRPVLSASSNMNSAVKPDEAGGDGFDLADVGISSVRFVRIVDKTNEPCGPGARTHGFDLDAVASVHAQRP
jgi:hypothetical protein